jgi:hypothetical protein
LIERAPARPAVHHFFPLIREARTLRSGAPNLKTAQPAGPGVKVAAHRSEIVNAGDIRKFSKFRIVRRIDVGDPGDVDVAPGRARRRGVELPLKTASARMALNVIS